MRALILTLLLISGTAYADEVITGFEPKDVPIINEELRKLDEANQQLSSRIAVLEADTGTSAATQAQMEAATVTTVYASPGRTIYHPGVAKAWCRFDGDTTGTNAPAAGYNVTSVTRNETGEYLITLGITLSSSNISLVGSATDGTEALIVGMITSSATAPVIETTNASGARQDPDIVSVVIYGDI